MAQDILMFAITVIVPYFSPIIFILGAILIADHLRGMLTSSFTLKSRRT